MNYLKKNENEKEDDSFSQLLLETGTASLLLYSTDLVVMESRM
jgi:hypothetical protein